MKLSNWDVYDAVNWAAYDAVTDAVDGAVGRTAYWAVDETVNRAVDRAVDEAVSWPVYDVLDEDPPHPGLQGFLSSTLEALNDTRRSDLTVAETLKNAV